MRWARKRYLPIIFLAAPMNAVAQDPSTGADVAALFASGETASLWGAMDPEMRATVGSAESFATFRNQVGLDFGEEAELLSERTTQDEGLEVHERVARWTGWPVPIQTIVALDEDGRISGFLIRPVPTAAESDRLDYRTKAALRLPFDGTWHVFWGGRTLEQNYHAVDPGQRFALDLVVMVDGQTHSGDPAVLAGYHCWDRPVLAPAAGRVARAVGDLPDQAIGASDPFHPAGNHVVIDFGEGEYGFLAHLHEGSVAVAEGDAVEAGQEIGRCGNSGNTSEPHLHFHLQTSATLGAGVGLPAQFRSYRADGNTVAVGEPVRGQTIEPAG